MPDFKNFQQESPVLSRHNIEQTCAEINNNLDEMRKIATHVSGFKWQISDTDKRSLLYLGSNLYDFYLLAEDSLLRIARTTDRWMPASLDWRDRLVKLMESPLPGKRPPVLSSYTASMLADYRLLFLNFHHQCSNFSPARIKKMTDNLDQLYNQLEKELTVITGLLLQK